MLKINLPFWEAAQHKGKKKIGFFPKKGFYEDFYFGDSSETETEGGKKINTHSKNLLLTDEEHIQQFEFLNRNLRDGELTDIIVKTPLKRNAERLIFNLE